MDHDDCREDTLTGANTSHRTNVMFVQPDNIVCPDERYPDSNSPPEQFELQLSKPCDLKNITTTQHHVEPYKTMKHVAPAMRNKLDTTKKDTIRQRERFTIHSLARLDSDGHCVARHDQDIGAFTGFQTCVQQMCE